MKSKRQDKILELIAEFEIETQEELIFYLNKYGFEATQATISRDIRELKLTKIVGSTGNYRYAAHGRENARASRVRQSKRSTRK